MLSVYDAAVLLHVRAESESSFKRGGTKLRPAPACRRWAGQWEGVAQSRVLQVIDFPARINVAPCPLIQNSTLPCV